MRSLRARAVALPQPSRPQSRGMPTASLIFIAGTERRSEPTRRPSAGLSKHDKRRRIREEIMVKNQPQPGRKIPYDDAHKPQLRSHRSICGSNRTR